MMVFLNPRIAMYAKSRAGANIKMFIFTETAKLKKNIKFVLEMFL